MSSLDCDKYRINIKSIKLMTEDKSYKEILDLIGRIAVSTSVPIIIVSCYIGEIYGFTPELDALIDLFKKFYVIDEILNIRMPNV